MGRKIETDPVCMAVKYGDLEKHLIYRQGMKIIACSL